MNLGQIIQAHGNWISMAHFMDLALFDEHFGYYSTRIPHIGGRGDFSTSASQSQLLARGIVAQWRESCAACRKKLPLIEIGGGTGDLMLDIFRQMSWWERLLCHYHMVEKSAKLRELQRSVGGSSIHVHADIARALKSCKGQAFIFSNELPDAFPARQFVFMEGEWYELGLAILEGQICRQAWKRPLPSSSVFERWAQDGQVVEVHESYHQWLAEWMPLWKKGSFITIDYGDVVERLYYRKPSGSLRGYKAHQLLGADELPALAGHCDITADVNFTDLHRIASECYGDVVSLGNQHDFLKAYVQEGNAADAHLIASPGPGDHFKVLQQHRFS